MNKQNKRGISTIIATVLIVLITVAAVTILWAAVSPLLDQSADLGCFEVANAIKIDDNVQYTYTESGIICLKDDSNPGVVDDGEAFAIKQDTNNDGTVDNSDDCPTTGTVDDLTPLTATLLSVRVERSADSDALDSFELILDNNGNSVPAVQVIGTSLEEDESSIQKNGRQVYRYLVFADVDGTQQAPDQSSGALSGNFKVSLVPKIVVDGEVTSCEAGAPVDVTPL